MLDIIVICIIVYNICTVFYIDNLYAAYFNLYLQYLMFVLCANSGDVLLHCVVDAINGALSLPDIGKKTHGCNESCPRLVFNSNSMVF